MKQKQKDFDGQLIIIDNQAYRLKKVRRNNLKKTSSEGISQTVWGNSLKEKS